MTRAFRAAVLTAALAALGCRAAPPSGSQRTVPSAPSDVAAAPSDARHDTDGVSSRLLEPGSGTVHPADNDRVGIVFTSWRRDGALVGSSAARDQPVVQSVHLLLRGLVPVVKAMIVGERRLVWMEASQTCADGDPGEPFACAGPLTVDIRLVGVQQAPPTPAELGGPPETAERTAGGLAYRVLREGSGSRHPSVGSRVTVLHTGWTQDGVVFESSAMAGQPTAFAVRELPAGLRQGVQLMNAGEKVRFWVPGASGPAPGWRRGRPRGPLVYDVELLAFE